MSPTTKIFQVTVAILLAVQLWFTAPLPAAVVEYTAGHADIGLAQETPGVLFLHYHFGVSAVLDGVTQTDDLELAPDEAYVRVSDATLSPSVVDRPYLGVSTGTPIWVLPQASGPPVARPGFATEELDPMAFSSAGFRMIGFSGPGNFALWQTGEPSANVFMQSSNGVDPLSDFLIPSVGSHDHYNWGFTQAGIYDITLEGFATRSGGSPTLLDSGTFRFVVGNATAVPESSSLLLLTACSIGALAWRRRAKQTRSSASAEV